MIVYLARAIQAFIMYCVNGTSRSSPLIESIDSMIQITEFRPSFNVHETQYVINFSKLNYLELAEYILHFDFSPCLNCNDIEIVWNQIRTIIHNAISLFAPKLKLRSR